MKDARFPHAETIPDHHRRVERWARDMASSEHDAEDAAQDVWVAALRQRERGFTRFGAWMRTVTATAVAQIRRRERSRKGRERIVARPEHEASFVEELERQSLFEFLAAQIERLREPYRRVVRMRYLDELELDEIAHQLERPPATVRVQLKRGLDELRARLEPRRTEQVFWGSALFGWLFGGRRVALKLSGLAALITVPVVGVIFRESGDRSPALADARNLPPEAPVVTDEAPTPPAPPVERTVVGDPAAPTLAGGGLPPDVAGDASVSGRVVDSFGAPVPGAEIQLSPPGDTSRAYSVAVTDARGEFDLTGVDGRSWIGARLEALRPSPRYPVEWLSGAEDASRVELVIERAESGRLVVLVQEPLGRPVANASVRESVGFAEAPFLGARLIPELHPLGTRGVTDANGRVLVWKHRGRPYLIVEADGHPATFGRQELPREEDETLTVRMPEPATLSGRASLPDGNPAADMQVELDLEQPLSPRTTRTDAEGRFAIGMLPPVRFTLRVFDDRGSRSRSLLHRGELVAGAPLDLDLTLSGDTSITGTLVDHDGYPMSDWTVTIQARNAVAARLTRLGFYSELPPTGTTTDDEGRFVFGGLCDQEFLLRAFPPESDGRVPHVVARRARPGKPELLKVTYGTDPSAYVLGRVHGTHLPEAAGLRLFLVSARLPQPFMLELDADGDFEGGPLPPGLYELKAHTRGLGAWEVETFRLGRDEERVLEPFECPSTGSLRVHIEAPEGLGGETPRLFLVSDAFYVHERLELGVDFDGEEAVIEPLPPGSYNVLLRTRGFCDEYGTLVVRSGAEHALRVRLRPGTMREFRIESPRPLDENESPRVVLHGPKDRSREFTLHQPTWQDPNTLTFGLSLRPGDYRVQAFFGNELSGAVSFTIESADDPAEELVIELREGV